MEKLQGNFSTTNSSLPKPTLYAGGFVPLDLDEWTLIIPIFLILICLLGLVGNVCVIAVLLHNARKANPSLMHSLILNLNISDLLLLMFSVPFRAAAYSRSSLNLGWFVCKTSDWFTHTCLSAKSITIAIAARACFMYASNPSKQVNIGHLTIFAVLVCIWLVAAVLPLPEWFFTDARQVDSSFICLMNIPAQAQEMMAIFVKLYPIFVYCIPFTLAFFNFWRAYGQCQRRGTKTQNLRNQIRSRRLTLMLLSVTVSFCILWLPEWVSWLWIWHKPVSGPSPPQAFVTLAQILMFSTSCVNPLIFLVMSEDFKEGFKDVWKRLTSKKSLNGNDIQDQGALNSEVIAESPCPGPESPEQPEPTDGKVEQSNSQNFGSQDSKENPVFPDVEQFWHGRELDPSEQNNDPIPWEHEEQGTEVPKSDTKL
ncbi:PREDICTED: probable G-protein coupled receptor 151 [Nanorana parkeri]|uniref:probable G-protein coupled receptor 151 n=1 Tax=Nanorana parkeri TaxID=125878 RepID=UPI000853FB38|nr:PREDICTED: probable G-protein coupled receptor 151 [Nanorana parkeri]